MCLSGGHLYPVLYSFDWYWNLRSVIQTQQLLYARQTERLLNVTFINANEQAIIKLHGWSCAGRHNHQRRTVNYAGRYV